MILEEPIRFFKRVGPARAETLKKLGIETVGDVLRHLPFRYEEWGKLREIGTLKWGEEVTIRGKIEKVRLQRLFWRKSFLRITVRDDSGAIDAIFFNQPYLEERFKVGEEISLHGKVSGKKSLVLPAPRIETPALPFPKEGMIVPIYPATEGIGQGILVSLISQALDFVRGKVEDPLEKTKLNRLQCFSLGEAFEAIHRPQDWQSVEAARRRLALEEFIELQRAVQAARAKAKQNHAVKIAVDTKLHQRILKRLPFELTEGQKKVVSEIRTDLVSGFPMRRLLQGDVGSGKTALAIYACLAAIGTGHQAAFMAPTEILAEQHARVLRRYLHDSKVKIALLVGSLKAAEKRAMLKDIANGSMHLVVGTHALIQEAVKFQDLALIVIDEQHRFGVLQREKLFQKGRSPHFLSMTATPIPRTLAMTVYGELDVSTLREKPPGRGKITTKWIGGTAAKGEAKLLRDLREHLDQGHQVYWVTPRIDDEAAENRSAIAAFKKLTEGPLKSFSIGLVHGKLQPQERDHALNSFRQGQIKILVATTLIEVGIDVPNARVIVIEGADRLGLAQLHQLRGRVGRGVGDSYCFLLGSNKAVERFRVLEKTDDGFEIAEADLAQRGPGELAGLRQSGLSGLSAASLEKDFDLLLAARDEAKIFFANPKISPRALVD